MKKPERIAKVIARSGFCSRREAERVINDGRVTVDGKIIDSPALNVTDEKITIDGQPLKTKEASRLFIYHKPTGLVTSHKDEQGRKTVFDSLPKHLPRVISIGRLDINSEGLLLLTNDGELAREYELPKNNFERVYRVRVFGKLPNDKFASIKNGVRIDGVKYGNIDVQIEREGANSWLRVTLTEGKNREIRIVMSYFGLEVSRLIRISYGKHDLGKLAVGEVKEVRI